MTHRLSKDVWAGVGFAIAIVVLGWLAYWNNLASGWHFDDAHTVLANDAIKNPSFAAIYKLNNYRQALYWVFAGSWALHGLAVRGWHIENNLIHIANGLLVYALTFLTLRTPAAAKQSRWPHTIAGIAGAIFVLHPLQTQAVTYITQRTESLCATFYLGALVLYAWARLRREDGRAKGSAELAALPIAGAVSVMILAATFLGLAGKLGPFLVLTALSFAGTAGVLVWLAMQKKVDGVEAALFFGALLLTLVACQTKEIAGTIPAAMLLWELVFMRPSAPFASWKDRARAHVSVAPYVAMLALLPILAVAVGLDVRLSLKDDVQNVYDIKQVSGKEYVLTQLNVLATYVRLYLLPYAQSLDYDYTKRTGLFDGPTWLSFAALAAVVAVAIVKRRSQPVFTFAVFFMLGVLAPTSLFVLPDFIFEHRVYLPLAAAAIVTALLLERVVRVAVRDEEMARKALIAVSVPVLAVLLVLTHQRNEVWATDETLWSDSAAKAPTKPRPLTNLGLYYQNVEPQRVELVDGTVIGGDFKDGAAFGRPDIWVVRTIFSGKLGAPNDFELAKARVKTGPSPWGGMVKAAGIYKQALAIDADYYKARNNYALCRVQQGMLTLQESGKIFAAAKEAMEGPRKIPADHPQVRTALAQAEALEKEALAFLHEGEAELKLILSKHPDDHVSLMNLASLYFGYLDRLDDAIASVEASIKEYDKEAISHAVAGEMYFSRANERVDKGDFAGALADFRKAVAHYTTFLERAGDGADAETIRHVQERKDKATQGILNRGEQRAEPKGGSGAINPFQKGAGINVGRGQRYKPGQR